MKRRITFSVVTALVTLGLAGLTACGSSGQGASSLDKDAKVSLTMWTGQTENSEKILEGLAAEFQKAHPNVSIDVSSGASSTDDLLQKLSAGFVGNSYPDISYAYGSWASELEASGRTLDITDRVAEPDVKWNEFPEGARLTARPTGKKTIGFPAIVDNLTLLYNKTVFDAAGVPYPTDQWTWDDLRAAAKKLTNPATSTYGYAYSVSGAENTVWKMWPQLWQNGGEILSPDQKTAAFDSDAGVKALTFLRDMAVTDKSVYLDQTDTKYEQLFRNNRIGMMASGPWVLYDLKTARTKYGVTLLPGTNGDHQTASGPDLWALFDHHDKNREYWAYEFANWLTSAAQDERWNVAVGNLPLRSSEVGSAAFKTQVKTYPGLDIMAANGANAKKVRPTVSGYVGLSQAIGAAISEVLQGRAEPKPALEKAATKANTALEAAR
ncbi:carbohydrate ABC transporter substrate-binding protein (CUT1 family) [Kribbella sp. VKM Ac-2569]|uniref:ABC transporter substrate-binding protein n=1 Tax=Kribbella sp. VKM Ac-2569 TaxID=2512220 RepID=UPI00102B3CF3|nr:extracellular solute-binding protein [Kribbella sp. VKM Ac-2569]RZT28516.1 carbohydrate ABC transporter substrate-binding protein (CUT1 family) [Kribbella sp. VKM Ac-2569]